LNKELQEHLLDLEEQLSNMEIENHYMSDFISYKMLTDEYVFFRQHAHEEQPEDCPFPYFTL